MSLSLKLYSLVAGFILFFIGISTYSYLNFATVQVNGPIYKQIVANKDIVADILPPPLYIVESYLTAFQLVEEEKADRIPTHMAKINTLISDYQTRHEYWKKELEAGEIREGLLAKSCTPALKFFQILKSEFIPAIEKGDKATARTILHGSLEEVYEQHRTEVDKVVVLATKKGSDDEAAANEKIHSTNTKILISSVSCLGIFSIIAIFLSHRISKVLEGISLRLYDAANQTSAASDEMAKASQNLAEGASRQAAALEETSASMEELTSMTRRNSENASSGNEQMKADRAISESCYARTKELAEAMNQMSKIIKSIDEIAFQTNILALNAAVEAARAGEAGMGFAVVADEVRNLAKRSADAAQETSTKIQLCIDLTHKVEVNMQELSGKTQSIVSLMDEIAMASKEQSQGLEQINISITQMDKITQSSASTSEETAAASEELHAQAESTKKEVDELVLIIKGERVRPASYNSFTTPSAKNNFKQLGA